MQGRIIGQVSRVNGPVLKVRGITDAAMMELVHVGEGQIVGEIVKLSGSTATVQVYEDATGIAPGDNVYGSGMSLSCQLAPGLIGNIYDGIQRPLEELRKLSETSSPEESVPALLTSRSYAFCPACQGRGQRECGFCSGLCR